VRSLGEISQCRSSGIQRGEHELGDARSLEVALCGFQDTRSFLDGIRSVTLDVSFNLALMDFAPAIGEGHL
jgi:hypothetical protein